MTSRLRTAGLVGPLIMTLVGLAVLLSLGAWQLQRKVWKEALIEKLAARAVATPVTVDEAAMRARSGEEIEYLRVSARGKFLHNKERYFYAPDPALGSGVNIYTPLELSGGDGVVFVNRGFVPDALKDQSKRASGLPRDDVEITGLVRMPSDRQRFVPENNEAANLWYWRDLNAMAESTLATGQAHLPFFVDAEAKAEPADVWPKGGATLSKLSNRHFEYALTWFGLAATLTVIYGAYAMARLRATKSDV